MTRGSGGGGCSLGCIEWGYGAALGREGAREGGEVV